MNTRKRTLALLLALALVASLFAACGTATPATSSEPAASSAASSEAASAESSPEAVSEPIKLEFFQQKRETADIITDIIIGFQEKYPNITVEQNNIPDAGTVLKTRVAAGDTPDIFSHWFNPDSRLLIDEGYVRDLTDETYMKKVQQQYIDFTKYQDKNWMVPVSINFVGVYYNKDVFDKYGITELPKTREEYYALCDKLKEAGEQVLEVTDKEQWTIGHGGTVIMENMFDTSLFLDTVINGDGSVADIPGFTDYMDWLEKSRKEYAQADFLGTAYEAGLGDFANGKGVMLMQGNWIIPVLKKANPDFNFGVFVFPSANAADTKPHWGIDYTLCLSGTPKSDAADNAGRLFLDYFVNTGAQMWADQDGSVSCIEGVKSGIPEYEPVSSMVLAGNAYAGWFSDTWPAGCYDQFNIAQQNFLTNFDREAFIKELDMTFKDFAE